MEGLIKVITIILTFTMLSACAIIPYQKQTQINEQETDHQIEVKPREDYTDLAQKMFYDLTFMGKQLEGRQLGLFDCISKDEFYARQQAIADKLNDLSETEFYFELRALIASIGVAHTTLNLNASMKNPFKLLPYTVQLYNDGWILTGISDEFKAYLGYEVTALNGIEMSSVKEKAKTLISYENDAWLNQQIPALLMNADALVFMGILDNNEALKLTLKKEDKLEEITLPSLSGPIYQSDILTAERPDIQTFRQPVIYTGFPLNEQTYYIQYNQCSEMPGYSMSQFTADVEKTLNEQHYDKLILDLRYNTGGNSAVLEPMLRMIDAYQQSNELKLITLISELTFSSGVMNAIQLKYGLNAVLIGTPSGGNVNGYGELQQFNLNYFPYTVNYCVKYFEMISGYEKDSLYPDIEVEVNYKDIMQGIDSCIEIAIAE